jgi:hypothetical protein
MISKLDMSSTIHVLKQIIDLLYEEQKYSEVSSLKNKIETLEHELLMKNKEISELYTVNADLENTIRQYEIDFELLSSFKKPIPNDVSGSETFVGDISGSEPIVEDVSGNTEEHYDDNGDGMTRRKRLRKEYMREYQKEYRKRQREASKMSMNL